MKFRNLLTAISVFAVCCLMSLFAFASADNADSPVVFIRGLLMVQLQQHDGLQVILPDAPGHQATITFVMKDGTRQVVPFKGQSTIRTTEPENSPAVVKVPELIRLRELFGSDVTPRLDHAPNKVSISWSSVRSVTTEEVSPYRYTFVRKDSGDEIETFRPRKIAETIRIELSPLGQLDFKPLKSDIDITRVKEIWVEQVPKSSDRASGDAFQQHFHHFLHYIDRPAGQNFEVEPRRLTAVAANVTPRFARSFWLDEFVLCGPVSLD